MKAALSREELRRESARVDPDPSEEQKKSGNYKKGHISFKGLPITIENAKGGVRKGVGKDGKPWRTVMTAAYGYIKRTESEADGDHVDVFLADDDLESEIVFVVNQNAPDGKFDEHKCVLGCTSLAAAKKLYLSNYQAGWKGLGTIAPVTVDQFKHWLAHSDTSKPLENFADAVARIKKEEAAKVPLKKSSATLDLAGLKEDLAEENAVDEAVEADEKLRRQDNAALAGGAVKYAMSYRFTGDVQGVHLRATLHKLLEEQKLQGLAYNNARTGDVLADIDAPEDKVQAVLSTLKARMAANPKVHNFDFTPVADRGAGVGRAVNLDDTALNTMFDRQGFNSVWKWHQDPAAARRAYVAKRYRLKEDPKTHALSGSVPELAYRQLMGKEPIYRNQMLHPEQFGGTTWTGDGTVQIPKSEPLAPALTPAPIPKLAASVYPSILFVKYAEEKKRPFTIAVDVDGTLAKEDDGAFDAKRIGDPIEENVKWVRRLHEAGARIILWTVRGDDTGLKAWAKKHEVPYDYIGENPDQPPGSSDKLLADVYWDNRAVNAAEDTGQEVFDRLADHQRKEDGKEAPKMTVRITIIRALLAPDDILEELLDED